ncbi:hypothetical protein LINGRAHAP2_LOCUS23602 [Linum grandiflorum]
MLGRSHMFLRNSTLRRNLNSMSMHRSVHLKNCWACILLEVMPTLLIAVMRLSLDLKGKNIGATRHALPTLELLSQMGPSFGAPIMTLFFRQMLHTCTALKCVSKIRPLRPHSFSWV